MNFNTDIEEHKDLSQQDSNIWSTSRIDDLIRRIDEEGLDYKEVDNPFHDQNPDLKKPNLLWEYTPEEIMEMKKCAEDVTYFAKYCQVMTDEGLSYIRLRDYQVSVLREYQANRFNVFLAPRQVGKCFLPTTYIIDNKNKRVPINNLKKIKKINFLSFTKRVLYKIYSFL